MIALEKPTADSSAAHRDTISVISPLTGTVFGTVPNLSAEEVAAVAQRARAAQPEWEALGVRARGSLLRAWADLLWHERKEMVRIIRAETGKNQAGALSEIFGTDFNALYYYHNAPHILRTRRLMTLFPFVQRATVRYRAHGLVGLICPWNYPLLLVTFELIPALIAGNAVLVKPSELSPYTSRFAVDLMHRAGIPEDIVQVITGDGTAGAAVVDNVDYVHVTGSTVTGRKIALRAAERLIPYGLELGGKDPLIILKDCDIELAATGTVKAALENAGQACVSTERIYVEAPIYDQFVNRVRELAARVRLSPAEGMDVNVGSMTSEREVRRVESQIAEAVAKGARVLYGGKRRPDLGPLFFEPTVIVDVNHSMSIMREETFGPVIPIMSVRDEEEAIRFANDSDFGLSASIYTRNPRRGERLARRIHSGDVGINRTGLINIGTPSLPTGGEKESGFGRRNGEVGLLRFVRMQSVMVDKMLYNPASVDFIDSMTLRTLYALRVIRRWLGFI